MRTRALRKGTGRVALCSFAGLRSTGEGAEGGKLTRVTRADSLPLSPPAAHHPCSGFQLACNSRGECEGRDSYRTRPP